MMFLRLFFSLHTCKVEFKGPQGPLSLYYFILLFKNTKGLFICLAMLGFVQHTGVLWSQRTGCSLRWLL